MEQQAQCRKCPTKFMSANQDDIDGWGECESCKIEKQNIAEKVQKIIDQRRAARPLAPPRIEPSTLPGTSYISSRQLL